MKYSASVSSSRRKARKAHFTSDSEARRLLMSSHLAKELRTKHAVRAVPIRKDDEVLVKRGKFKGREGKVTAVYRKKFVIHVERVVKDKADGKSANVGIHPSNVEITKFGHLDASRKAMLLRKKSGKETNAAKAA